MPKFKVGDKVWQARCRWEPIRKLCPTCFGKMEVTLILGNGDSVILPCQGCAQGYEPPVGHIYEYDYVLGPELLIITGMDIEVKGEKEKVRYHSALSYVYDEEDLFLDQAEALAKSKEKKRILDEEQKTKSKYLKEKANKSFSWNACYHRREAKRNRKQAEYHDSKAVLCKARAKTDEVKGGSDD